MGEDWFSIFLGLNADSSKKTIDDIENKKKEMVEDVDKATKEADQKTEFSFLKAVQTVQQIESIVRRVLSLTGYSLGSVGNAVASIVGKAASTLIPLLTAEALSGWQTIQAMMAIADITMSIASIPSLVAEAKQAGNLDEIWIQQSNTGIGRINTII